jgi:hypothetical protein
MNPQNIKQHEAETIQTILYHPETDVRAAAVRELESVERPRMVASLISVLTDMPGGRNR